MVNKPSEIPDEKLAPNIIKKSLEICSRLLVLVGKPLYLLLTAVIISLLYIATITSRITSLKINLKINLPKKRLKDKGIIFSSKWFKLKQIASQFKLYSNSKISSFKQYLKDKSNKAKELSWKTEIFLLAFEKLLKKIKSHLVAKLKYSRPKDRLVLLPLKIKILFIYLVSFVPRYSLPKISRLKFVFFLLSFVLVFSFTLGFVYWFYIFKDLPSPEELTLRQSPSSTKIYDRNRTLLYTIYDDKNRTPVDLDSIPLNVRLATLAIEDAEFYSHPGFSVRGIVRAALKNWRQGEISGGSTITQQLVKNSLLTSEKTLVRKLREITLAVKVEMTYSKNEILEMYLNEVSYGGTAYGIQEAARSYFNKDVDSLTLSEAALLAGLPKSPTQYSPFGPHPQFAIERRNEVLNRMYQNGFITESQKEESKKESLHFAENKIDIKAPHFVMYVRQKLEEKYGKELVEKGGLNVITTLDYTIQELAEKIVKDEVDKLAKLNVKNGASIVLSPATGEILAMVGSKNYFDTQNDGNVNITTSLRQPGSSIKIINYAYALSNGYSPATIIADTPVTFLIPNLPPYTPKNYEGGFRGNLTLRSAFAESRNIPAVKVLNSYGVKNMIDIGRKMGITSWNNPDNYGLSLTLGGGEVKLLDLAYAYATVANYGQKPEERYILKITNSKGKVLEDNLCGKEEPSLIAITYASSSAKSNYDHSEKCVGQKVLDPRVAFIITDILKDNTARAPSFGSNSLLVIPNHKEVAVKTGTSNNLRDNLTLGYNQTYLVATWVGNNDNSEMARIASGVTGASPIFNKIMSALLADQENHDWSIPEGLAQVPICLTTGTLSCEGCPNVRREWFLAENVPQRACSQEWFKKPEESAIEVNIPIEEKPKINPTPTIQYLNPGQFIDQIIDERINKKRKPRN